MLCKYFIFSRSAHSFTVLLKLSFLSLFTLDRTDRLRRVYPDSEHGVSEQVNQGAHLFGNSIRPRSPAWHVSLVLESEDYSCVLSTVLGHQIKVERFKNDLGHPKKSFMWP